MLNHLWGLGRTNVKRIRSEKDFHYLLKYVTKGGSLPEWALKERRIRIFQTSRGFYKPKEETAADVEAPQEEPEAKRTIKRRASYTIGERLERWKRIATYIKGDKVRPILLCAPFQDLLGLYVLAIARAGNYLGNGRIKITTQKDIIPWLIKPTINSNKNASAAST